MLDVVVDEGSYIRALEAECTLDRDDLRWARVIERVQEQHRWILTNDILRAYYRQFGTVSCRAATTTLLKRSLKSVLVDVSRLVFIDEPAAIEGEYDRDDIHVVAAAAGVEGSHLFTTDERLVASLLQAEITARRGFNVHLLTGAETALGLR